MNEIANRTSWLQGRHSGADLSATVLRDQSEFAGAVARILTGRRRFEQQVSFFLLELVPSGDPASSQEVQSSQFDSVRIVGERLMPYLRKADIVACIAPERFAIVPAYAQNSREAAAIARRLLETCRDVVQTAGEQVEWLPSIGIARFSADAADVPGLLQAATEASCRATRLGGNRYCFFSNELNTGNGDMSEA